MKNKVKEFITQNSGVGKYSGNTKTMHIEDNSSDKNIEELVLSKFGYNLPFKLSTN